MASATKAVVQSVPPLYSRILSLFPQQYFRFCFAYGSGVFKQSGVKTSKPMIDFIFVVDDAAGFHGQNIHLNPSHYSSLKYLGHTAVASVQENWGAKVYFNTLIPLKEEGVVIKYGVITRNDLVNDLLDWNYLYLAGRLHKPVQVVHPAQDEELVKAVRSNLFSALHAAFLILPEFFTERHLYRTIANLSYMGDFRMFFGEDKNKVKNIVDPQVHAFKQLYAPLLAQLDDYVEIPLDDSVDQVCMQDMSPNTRMYHLFQLPREPQRALVRYWTKIAGRRIHDTEEILRAIAFNPDVAENLSSAMRTIVFDSSLKQSLKGILTAGLIKSIRYSNSKVMKMFKSSKAVT